VILPGSLPFTTEIKTIVYYIKQHRKWWYSNLSYFFAKKLQKPWGGFFL